jgi:NAD-dependent SIR2 family protein deacetylase
MKEFVEEERIPRCKTCKGLVKPDIVFFGESVSYFAEKALHETALIQSFGSFLQISLVP